MRVDLLYLFDSVVHSSVPHLPHSFVVFGANGRGLVN